MSHDRLESRQCCQEPEWQRDLLFENLLLDEVFPQMKGYQDSMWAGWDALIQDGKQKEETRVSQLAEKWLTSAESPSCLVDPADWMTDAYWQVFRLQNIMRAALVVAIWSHIEEFLKRLITICDHALGVKKKPPYQFDEIRNFFQNRLELDMATVCEFATVDAIRVLNNTFKHRNGVYTHTEGQSHARTAEQVEEQCHKEIDRRLLERWDILIVPSNSAKEIDKDVYANVNCTVDYTRLPIDELAIACNSFFSDLLCRIKEHLHTRVAHIASPSGH